MPGETFTNRERKEEDQIFRVGFVSFSRVKERRVTTEITCSTSPSPATSNRTFGFPEYGFPIIFFQRHSQSPLAWLSGIVLLRSYQNRLEFIAFPQSPLFSSFENTMKVLPLPSLKVMLSLRYRRYYWQIRLPYRPSGISIPLYPPVVPIVSGHL